MYLAAGSTAAPTKMLNEALAGAGGGAALHANRLHALLANDVSRGLNEASLALIERAVETAGGGAAVEEKADAARTRLQADLERARRFGDATADELARRLSVPPAVLAAVMPEVQAAPVPASGPHQQAGTGDGRPTPDWSYQDKEGLSRRDRMLLRRTGQSALRLLQLVTNPALLARIPFEHQTLLADVLGEGDSPKLEYACYRARELAFEGRKSIIWSSFVDNVEFVANRLIDLGAEYIHGGVDAGDEESEGTREQKIRRFHEDENCFVLVANPASCGEGISLHTVCHNAIYLDRNYNAAQFLQSQDRIHRLGLPQGVTTNVEILVAPNTVDDSVQRRLDTKIENMEKVLGDNSICVDPEVIDLDADGFNQEDFSDFIRHINTTTEDA